ncbi:MAG: transcription termination/antitermination protein NusG [Shinella sp.]|nr:transcription termination/antitermination protein NusG [Shinella sp.]
MTMQHKRGTFGEVAAIEIRPYCDYKQDKAIRERRIAVTHLSMASKSVVERISGDYPEMKPGWYCLRVMTGREMAVEKCLGEAGVEVLVVRSNPYRVVCRGRVKEVSAAPVITGYVLVHCLPIAAAIAGLLSVNDVIEIVGGPMNPYRANEEEIAKFKDLANRGKYDHRKAEKVKFMVGEHVRVCDGPFASFPGVVTAIDEKLFRISVEVNIFGRATPVELDLAQIEKV